uniref:Uncharacterized protein n=1 Tax=Pithovirus LCPAC404 TaxID=2506597 RepID=A0A481ZBP5_9VIRU|nr:MAG: hypothetical protein LCPAC404_00120 [Pithovirus LCPAC404]
MDNIKECVQLLARFNNRSVNSLDPQMKKCVDDLKIYRSQNPQIYSRIINQHHRPVNLQPGTVGVALFGCEQSFYGNIEDDRCSCLCLQDTCSKQVWILSRKKLQKLNESSDPFAYLYVPRNFRMVDKFEEILRKAGIKEVCLLDTSYSKHTVLETIKFDKKKDIHVAVNDNDDESNEDEEVKSNKNWIWWIIVFVILIVAVAYWINFGSSKKVLLERSNILLGRLRSNSHV